MLTEQDVHVDQTQANCRSYTGKLQITLAFSWPKSVILLQMLLKSTIKWLDFLSQ